MLKLCGQIARRLNLTAKAGFSKCRQLSQTNVSFDAKPSQKDESPSTSSAIKWDKIYQMDEINFLSIVSKLKLYHGGASVALIPFAYIGELTNTVPQGVTLAIIAMSFSGLSMLFAFSAVANNTIGIIYVCPKNVNIRFAYLDLWGYRQHYDTTIDNIAEPGSLSIFGLCQNVELRNGTKTFKLATRHGHILDFDLYEKLFGSLRK